MASVLPHSVERVSSQVQAEGLFLVAQEHAFLPLRKLRGLRRCLVLDGGRLVGGHEDDDALLRRIQHEPEPDISPIGDNRQARELRTYGIGAQIITDLGIRRMRVLSAPKIVHGIAGFGLEVVEYVPCELP